MPPPHAAEHGDQALHAAQTHGTAHGDWPQRLVSRSAPPAAQPHVAGAPRARTRARVPPPHEAEHGDHGDHGESAAS